MLHASSIIIISFQVPTIATGEVFTLKLVDNGVPRDKIAALAVFSLPLSILLPIAFRRKVIESRPMEVFKTILPYRFEKSSFEIYAPHLVSGI